MIKQIIIVIAGVLLLGFAAAAQEKSQEERLPAQLMREKFPTLDGGSVQLSELRGKTIVVILWAAWCGPCRLAAPKLNEIGQQYINRDVEMISFASDDAELEETQAVVDQLGLGFKVGWIPAESVRQFGGRGVIPQILIISDQGVVIKRFEGWNPNETPAKVREALDQALDPRDP